MLNTIKPSRYSAEKATTKISKAGNYICNECGEESASSEIRYRLFCSHECLETWKIKSSPSFLRLKVYKRDKGICVICGINCVILEKARKNKDHNQELESKWQVLIKEHRIPPRLWDINRTFWEADHIIEVADGGGSCDLSNIQTLCWKCHYLKTRRFMKKRFRKSRLRKKILRKQKRELKTMINSSSYQNKNW